jgi:hypothetical protein
MRFILLCVVADELETAIALPKEWEIKIILGQYSEVILFIVQLKVPKFTKT